jgi:hypothetical protein
MLDVDRARAEAALRPELQRLANLTKAKAVMVTVVF